MWGQVRVVVLDEPAVVEDLASRSEERQGSYEFVQVTSVDDALDAIDETDGPTVLVTTYPADESAGGESSLGDDGEPIDDGGSADHGKAFVDRVTAETAVPVIVYTDAGSERVAAEATLAGAAAYVPKGIPDASTLVLEAVGSTLERSVFAENETREKIETLHDVATDLEACETEAELFERTIDAAEQVLAFDQCLLDIRQDDLLVPVATSSGLPEGGAQTAHVDDEAVASRVARTQEATINDDLSEVTDADPAEMTYRSGFTVPVSDIGVFQAVSEELAAFDEDDLELAQLLVAHVAESLKRIRNREELRDERDRFAALFQNVPDPAVRASYDEETGEPYIEAVNSAFAEAFGCDQDVIAGTALRDVVEPSDSTNPGEAQASMDAVIEDVQAGDGVVAREVRRQAKDGIRDFILHIIPVHGHEGEVYGIYTDITATKERERTLERQNDRLDDFASVVSHDLRNPLNVAEGHLVNYRETGETDSLDDIEYAHERMRSLIEDLLELARSGEVVADSSPVDTEAVATEAWMSVQTDDAELVLDDPPRVAADKDRLRDVFANLFRNSVEHNTDDCDGTDASMQQSAGRDRVPSVTVTVGRLPESRGFFVADDGMGIPPAERERVFETGYTNAAHGSGFGLAIVSQVAHAHDWSIRLTDGAAGGARFEFRDVNVDEEASEATPDGSGREPTDDGDLPDDEGRGEAGSGDDGRDDARTDDGRDDAGTDDGRDDAGTDDGRDDAGTDDGASSVESVDSIHE